MACRSRAKPLKLPRMMSVTMLTASDKLHIAHAHNQQWGAWRGMPGVHAEALHITPHAQSHRPGIVYHTATLVTTKSVFGAAADAHHEPPPSAAAATQDLTCKAVR